VMLSPTQATFTAASADVDATSANTSTETNRIMGSRGIIEAARLAAPRLRRQTRIAHF